MMLKYLSQIRISEDELDIPTDVEANDTTFLAVLETTFALLGVIAFLVIVIAGLRFILSQGDPDKSAKARNTVIYAVVGLVIAVSAFSLIRLITDRAG